MVKEIGGFFSLESSYNHDEYYGDLIRFNTARNAILYVVLNKGYSTVHVPYFTCSAIIDTLVAYQIEIEFYSINEHLEIKDLPLLSEQECLIYTNYFGVKENYIHSLVGQINNLIIDNAQGFYSKPIINIDTVYSARKFFGLPDGAYLSSNLGMDIALEKDVSYERFIHLIKRIDLGAEKAYQDFKTNDGSLESEAIKSMSNLTQFMLSNSIDYVPARNQRNENYAFLHDHLKIENKLAINFDLELAPMVYPFLTEDKELRQKLIDNKVFVATYWPDVLERCSSDSIEAYFTEHILPLPIDQRYGVADMERIISLMF